MQYTHKTWKYALVAVSIMVVAGLGTAYAVPLETTPFEEFCEEISKIGWGFNDAADFICDVDIYQMKSDIEEVKNISFDSRVIRTSTITIDAHDTLSHIVACSGRSHITNVGYVRDIQLLPPITESGLDLYVSYQLDDINWFLSFANPTDESIKIHIKYNCLG